MLPAYPGKIEKTLDAEKDACDLTSRTKVTIVIFVKLKFEFWSSGNQS
jgi:hypothetical protein